MEWPLIATHLSAAGIAFFGGLLCYLKKHKRKDRRMDEALIAASASAILGACLAMIGCWKFCETTEEKWVMIAAAGLSGLAGLTPKKALAWALRVLGGVPKDEPRPDPYIDPPSD